MSRFMQIFFSVLLLAVFTLGLALPAQAFDGRTDDRITIPAGEVVEDDLYLAGEVIVVDGTIKGDLIAAGQTIIINGTVEGDLLAAGRDVIINGTVRDDARIFGAAFLIGENAVIGDDLVGGGGSLETRSGSKIGGDLVMGCGQALLAGDVTGKAWIGSSAIELRGAIGGDAVFALGRIENENQRMGPMIFDPEQTITVPSLMTGLKFGPDARIDGKLEYITNRDLNVPESVAAGGFVRTEPIYSEDELREIRQASRTPVEQALSAGIDVIRSMASLILVGLLMLWIFPSLLVNMSATIQRKPLPSLGWGVVAYATFFFSLLVILFLMIVGGILLGALTLGGLSASVIVSGLLAIFGISVGFVLFTTFVTKLAISLLAGKLILEKLNPQLAEHKFWPLALGIILFAVLQALPIVGILVQIATVLLGLGALWLLLDGWRKARIATPGLE
jgi:cytoskeletal protein CcmA (bactofilin family)